MPIDLHPSCTTTPPAMPGRRVAYRFGDFTLDLSRGMLLAGDGSERRLRAKSFELLVLLVENAGRLLSQGAILDALWPGVFITENSVNQCICDIRRALGTEASGMLRTLSRRGYLFTPEVEVVSAAGLPRHGVSEIFQGDFSAVSGLRALEVVSSDPRQKLFPPCRPRSADRPAA